ncbi:hypothetical protein [Verrucosispora sp. WMMD1129]|uniref:hypothetical protein n=1 Tax=Verrucosispora sp. WMMD1129 TaxID=3016093 RepID=UPI00249CF212|nr:hypothetical protein [Verrucosispora sp. WMMD1129]WFE45306.1 hypothetical protein O7624_13575 [Verrucosispora sp. WMMD1129]
MGSSIPGALDYLARETRALDAVKDARAAVSDGWPTERTDQMIALGVLPEDEDTTTVRAWAELSREEYENVEVPAIIAVRRAGSTAASDARRDAFVLFDAIQTLIRSDRRFGGAVVPGMPVRIARSSVSQTADVRQAGEGRVCEVRFVIAWQHRS